MRLVKDKESFEGPLDSAIEQTVQAVIAAGTPVKGAEQRVRAALEKQNTLREFCSEITALLKNNSFNDLPLLHKNSRAVPYCHHLTVGPWRGIFVIHPSSEFVVALVFSEEPHQLKNRLGEINLAEQEPIPDEPVS